MLLAIANALSHDIYYKMIDPKADTKRRLFVAKALLLVVAVVRRRQSITAKIRASRLARE